MGNHRIAPWARARMRYAKPRVTQALPGALMVFVLQTSSGYAGEPTEPDTFDIEQLMSTAVTTVSRSEQRFADSAAAVFVISREDLRRSGATTVPDALRMVPGVQVARIDASKWAVTIRGNNGRFANKLLVLIDGRTLYTPSFSGVYWETEDLLLEDIERIEVVRGPGASVWGANAVHGVINILTRRAEATQGGLVTALAGDEEQGTLGLRWGGALGTRATYRIYAKQLERDDLVDERDEVAGDDWRLGRGGFRLDWTSGTRNAVSLFGDLYDGTLRQNYLIPDVSAPSAFTRSVASGSASGGSLMARWEHTASLASRFTTQVYYQHFVRDDAFQDEQRNTFDLDFQHELGLPNAVELIWGIGYRRSSDRFRVAPLTRLSQSRRDLDLVSGFTQIRAPLLSNRAEITAGAKLEYHTLGGWQLLPSLRLLGRTSEDTRLWGAISRATRTPSRGEHDVVLGFSAAPPGSLVRGNVTPLPLLVLLEGNDHFDPEQMWAFELGGRTWPTDKLFLDLTAFYHVYDDTRLAVLAGEAELAGDHLVLPTQLINGETGRAWGLELATDWRPTKWLRLALAYSHLRSTYDLKSGVDSARVILRPPGKGRDPKNQVSLRAGFDLLPQLDLDLWLRHMGEIPNAVMSNSLEVVRRIDAYTTLDARLAWRPIPSLELSLVGQNLLDAQHLEYVQEVGTFPTQVERSFYGQIRWGF